MKKILAIAVPVALLAGAGVAVLVRGPGEGVRLRATRRPGTDGGAAAVPGASPRSGGSRGTEAGSASRDVAGPAVENRGPRAGEPGPEGDVEAGTGREPKAREPARSAGSAGRGPVGRSSARPADPAAPVRVDPLPETLEGYWPAAPGPWVDAFGVERSPLEKAENPAIALGDFWLREEVARDDGAVRSGAYRVETDREVALEPGRTTVLRGRVVDGERGTLVAGATVVLFSIFYKRQVIYDHHLQEVAGTTSGPDGSFALAGFNVEDFHFGATGKAFLTIRCEGYAARVCWYLAHLRAGVENDVGDVPLERGGLTLRGAVVNRRGEPVPGAVVAATGELYPTEFSKDQRYRFLPRFPHAVCGADGSFALPGILGRHWITVHVGEDSVSSELRDFYGPGDPAPVRLVVLAGGFVEGRVVDGEDRPVADAVVYGGQNSTHSYADGRYRLENVAGAVFDVVVRHHRFRTAVFRDVRAGETDRTLALLDPLPQVVFVVRDAATAKPCATVRIRFTRQGQLLAGAGDSPLFHAEDGRFAAIVPEGADHAILEAEGHHAHARPLEGVFDGDEIEVALTSLGE